MAAFANLTEAERERLEMLIEEAGEIITIATKVLRHGYDNHHPDDAATITNRVQLEREVLDLQTVYTRMMGEGDVSSDNLLVDLNAEWKRKLFWTRHQKGSPQ